MLSVLLTYISGRQHIFNILIIFVILCTINCKAFIIHRNSYYLTNCVTKYRSSNEILNSNPSNFKCNSKTSQLETTHSVKNDEYTSEGSDSTNNVENPSNILALLSDYDKKTKILHDLTSLILEKKLDTNLLYVTTSDQHVLDLYESFNQTSFKNKLNLISSSSTVLSKSPLVTLANASTLLGYYNYFNNDIPFTNPESVKYNNVELKQKTSKKFEENLNSIIGNFFINDEEIANEKVIHNPNTSVDKEFLTSIRNWTDNNYIDGESLVKTIKEFNNNKNKKGIVIFDNFDFDYDTKSRNLTYSFNDELIALLNKNCSFVGFSNVIYNPQPVKDWLTSIFGPIKVVSMCKSPKFQLLTAYGYLDAFVETNEPDFKKLEEIDENNIIQQSYNYFTKKSNFANMDKINPDVKLVLVKNIENALKHRRIDTYNKLIHYSTLTRNIFKNYIKEFRFSPEFAHSSSKIHFIIDKAFNIGDNKLLMELNKAINIFPSVKKHHKPSPQYLMAYINEKNLYPTVVYEFRPYFYKIINQFYRNLFWKKRSKSKLNSVYESNTDTNTGADTNANATGTNISVSTGTDSNGNSITMNTTSSKDSSSDADSNTNEITDPNSNSAVDSVSVTVSDNDTQYNQENKTDESDCQEFLQNMNVARKTLFENGICVLMETDDDKFKRYVLRNAKKFKVILSNYPVPSAPHYIFLDANKTDLSLKTFYTFSNNQIYSMAQGAELVTFTVDLKSNLHVMKSILLPIYLNLNKIKHSPVTFYKHKDILVSRLFSSYLRSCRNQYVKDTPGHFEKKRTYDKLDKYFKESNLDTESLIKLTKKNNRILKFFSLIGHSLKSKLFFKNKLINYLNDYLDLRGSIILGIDNNKYKILYSKLNLYEILKFSNRKVENDFNNVMNYIDARHSILQKVDSSECLLVENKFIKDIIKIEEHKDPVLETIVVEYFKHFKLKVNNDLEKFIEFPNEFANVVFLNTLGSHKSAHLSSMLPKYLKNLIFEKIEEYNSNSQKIDELYKNANKNQEFGDNFVKNEGNEMESLSKEYIKLNGDLKRDKMEHILKNNRIISSFWGK